MDTNITTAGALLVGLATSFHCAGMCGPLACGVCGMAKNETERLTASTLYHSCRLLAYSVIGSLAGALGQQPLKWFFNSPAVLLPWALVAALLMLSTGLEKKIPRPAIFSRLTARARFKATRLPALGGAAAMGLLTPFLPCTPLYAVFIALMASGSAVRGAETALAFGLGTVPLLWLAQSQFHRLRVKLGPTVFRRCQRGLALAAALVMAWRLHGTLPSFQKSEPPQEEKLPSCCHDS
jgi:uncharacterized protein